MGKAKREREQARKRQVRRNIIIGVVAAAIVVAIAISAVMAERAKTSYKDLKAALNEDGSLHISRKDLGKGFNYVSWGGAEELILYKSESGEVVSAFDTCEECYPKGEVHFTRNDTNMVCNICGVESAVLGLGAQSWGGCQPVAIPAAARQDTESEIVISGKAIDYATHMFGVWDEGDMSVTFEQYEE